MKKITILLFALLMVFSVGQAALANGKVGIFAGYAGLGQGVNGFNVNASASYEFNNWFSLGTNMGGSALFSKEGLPLYIILIDLAAKFDVYETNKFTLGLQAVLADSIMLGKSGFEQNSFLAGPGLYLNWDIAPKIDFYLDLYIPMLMVVDEARFNYIPLGKLGASYAINSNMRIGIEGGYNAYGITAGAKFSYSF